MSVPATLAGFLATAVVASCVTLNGVPKPGGAPAERAGPQGAREAVVAKSVAPLAAAEADGGKAPPAAGPPRLSWEVKSGETLRQVLKRWGADADVEVVFLTDRMWILKAPWRSHGSFGDAVADLTAALEYLPHPPHAGWAAGGGSVIVRHRERLREGTAAPGG